MNLSPSISKDWPTNHSDSKQTGNYVNYFRSTAIYFARRSLSVHQSVNQDKKASRQVSNFRL